MIREDNHVFVKKLSVQLHPQNNAWYEVWSTTAQTLRQALVFRTVLLWLVSLFREYIRTTLSQTHITVPVSSSPVQCSAQ